MPQKRRNRLDMDFRAGHFTKWSGLKVIKNFRHRSDNDNFVAEHQPSHERRIGPQLVHKHIFDRQRPVSCRFSLKINELELFGRWHGNASTEFFRSQQGEVFQIIRKLAAGDFLFQYFHNAGRSAWCF